MHNCVTCFIILLSFEKILSQIRIELGEKVRRQTSFRRQEEEETCVGIYIIGLACYTYIPMVHWTSITIFFSFYDYHTDY